MKLYELFFIFLAGAALGVIARYILGYRKKHAGYVALNVLFGGASCALNATLFGAEYYSFLLSGAGGVIFDFLYCAGRLIRSAV